MSRIGKQPIPIPAGVTVEIKPGVVSVQGPKGTLRCPLHHNVVATMADGVLTVLAPRAP